MGDKSTGNLIGDRAQKCKVIWCEILGVFFVSHLEYSNSVVAKLDWDEKHVTDYLMQLLIHSEVVAELFPDPIVHSSLEMPSLSSVEYLAKHILGLPLKADRFAQPARNHLAEKSVLDAVIEKHWASFHVK